MPDLPTPRTVAGPGAGPHLVCVGASVGVRLANFELPVAADFRGCPVDTVAAAGEMVRWPVRRTAARTSQPAVACAGEPGPVLVNGEVNGCSVPTTGAAVSVVAAAGTTTGIAWDAVGATGGLGGAATVPGRTDADGAG